VWLAWGDSTACHAERLQLEGSRADVRHATVRAALRRLLEVATR
jgi:nicotinamide mononucleotide (NMN) deamidase PncC